MRETMTMTWKYTIFALIIKNKWVEEIFSRYLKKAISFHHWEIEYLEKYAMLIPKWEENTK